MPRLPTGPEVSWEQTRGFRLQRMHLVSPLGPRSLRRVARDLGGIQAQVHSAAELQAATRMQDLAPGALERALYRSRTLVKTWMMRGTIHYLDPSDLPVWAAASKTRELWRKPYWQKAFGLTEREVEAAVETIARALDGEPMTREALADEVLRKTKSTRLDELMRAGWGSVLKIAAAQGLLCFGPNRGRNVTFVRPDRWLKSWTEVSVEEAIAEVCRRYLTSHGPATREEFARWWGFSPADARRALEAMGDEVVLTDRAGDKAYILARDLERARDTEEDDEVRVLGMFDAYTLAGLPSDEIVPRSKKERVYRKGAWVSQVVMRGGRVAGTWTHDTTPKGTRVEMRLFRRNSVTRRSAEQALAPLRPFIGNISAVRVTST